LCAFRSLDGPPDAPPRVGLVLGAGSQTNIHAFPEDSSIVGLLAAGDAAREAAADEAAGADGRPLHDVRLLPPVYPVAMRHFAALEAHVDGKEMSKERSTGNPGPPASWYEAPEFLFVAPHAVVGPYDDVPYPPGAERLGFEPEIAVVTRQDVRNVTPEQARAAIGGYLVMNHWTARDIEAIQMTLKRGPVKERGFVTTIGPWIVTPDEPDHKRDCDGFLDLQMQVQVNGRLLGADRSGNMSWSFEQLISYASRASRVRAGAIIGSGTCSSASVAKSWDRTGRLDHPPLKVGDVVEISVEGLGTLRNRIVVYPGEVPGLRSGQGMKDPTSLNAW
jgi:2-keto-4-pentenoate hydratase/2-oxohepta-3-ene-1,7-dioic acid hydratase in catechol pathway